jgi:hypothetical protein
MCSGGGPTGIGFVDNAIDKADNWTEGVGDQLEKIDPGPAIGDLGEQFDKEVLQKVDVGTVATVAAIATQQYYLVPYISAANTAIKGGDITDIAVSFGISYAATTFAPMVSAEIGGTASQFLGPTAAKIATSAATGATIGAGTGAARAAASGKSIAEGAGKGAIVGGVTGAVSSGVGEAYGGIKNEFGIGSTYSPDLQADADFVAAKAESARSAGAGEEQIAQILKQEGVQSFTADDVANLTASGVGEKAVAQNIAGSYNANEIYTPPPTPDTGLEKAGKKLASETISKSILNEVMPSSGTMPDGFLTFRTRSRYSPTDDMTEDLTGFGKVALTEVAPAKYDLKRFVNAEGQSTMIPFKDDEPQAPIPSGFKEVETIGAAEGGLISTTMVKYSKKPLLAPRKKVTKPKKTASKGLASKI